MRNILLLLLLSSVLLITGCPKSMPVKPEVVEQIANYEVAQLNKDMANYECAASGETFNKDKLSYTTCGTNVQNLSKARQLRNNIIYRLVRITDYNYFQFENDLYVSRASGSFLADVTDVGANFAATITNGERAKTIINSAIIAFRGGRKSGSINYFQQQTADVLITKMQTSRNRILAEILTQMRDKDVNDYSLEAGLGDVIKYFYAGTLPRALQELKQDTSQNAKEAVDELRKVKDLQEPGIVSKERRDEAVDSNETLNKLLKDLDGSNEAKTDALKQLKDIIKELEKDAGLKVNLVSLNINSDSNDGKAIVKALKSLKRDKSDVSDEDALTKINKIIVKFGKKSETENN